MNKIAIYTCITGGYDELRQPATPAPEGFDFIQFVPLGTKTTDLNGVWKVREFPEFYTDATILSRFPKLCPHTLLKDYEYSLWVDGNVRIADPRVYDICLDLMEKGVQYAGIKHPKRDCPYDECERVLKDERDNVWHLLRVVYFLHKKGLPHHSGLMENNVIFRKHNDPSVIEFDSIWMERFVRYSPRRDQLVHTISLKTCPDMEYVYFLPEGETAMNSKLFEYTRHPTRELPLIQRKIKYGWGKIASWMLHKYIQWFS